MLTYNNVFSSWSVNDLARAKTFYEQTLGLPVKETPEGLSINLVGGQNIFIYPKPNHEPATFTVFNFAVADVDNAVDTLTAAGVRFLQYEGEIKTDKKGIMRNNGPVIAWFTDPAGNIFSVVESPFF
jgi:predicted enzyme related to lactoylglutathione lyase